MFPLFEVCSEIIHMQRDTTPRLNKTAASLYDLEYCTLSRPEGQLLSAHILTLRIGSVKRLSENKM